MADKKCIVIGAGDLTVGQVMVGEEDLVIAVDGGINYCGVLEIEPDILIGDFDSVNETQREAILQMKEDAPERVVVLKPEKDDTDMLAALRLGLEKGYDYFLIYGGLGGRIEHTMANIQCLLFLKNNGAVGYLMEGSGMVFVMKNEEVKLRDNLEGYFSLFSLGKEAKGVTIKGMKYEVEDYHMTNDFPIGVSNEFIGKEATISVEDGELVGIVNFVSE